MNLYKWQKLAERGTSGDMVHNILMDWARENVAIDGNGWYCYTCATTFAQPGDCPICLGKLVAPPAPQPNDALLVACKLAARVMNDYGNATNWPSDMPMEYAETVNALRAAVDEAEAKE